MNQELVNFHMSQAETIRFNRENDAIARMNRKDPEYAARKAAHRAVAHERRIAFKLWEAAQKAAQRALMAAMTPEQRREVKEMRDDGLFWV